MLLSARLTLTRRCAVDRAAPSAKLAHTPARQTQEPGDVNELATRDGPHSAPQHGMQGAQHWLLVHLIVHELGSCPRPPLSGGCQTHCAGSSLTPARVPSLRPQRRTSVLLQQEVSLVRSGQCARYAGGVLHIQPLHVDVPGGFYCSLTWPNSPEVS
jgi:hypothetical protein